MKTFLTIAAIVTGVLIYTFDFYIDGHCPTYQSSNYVTGVGEIGEKCEVTFEVRKVEELYTADFMNEWTPE